MAAMMGFGSFGTSKGKQVEDNAEGFAEIKKEHSWRQYMNRYVDTAAHTDRAEKEALTGLWTRSSRRFCVGRVLKGSRGCRLQDRVVAMRPARGYFV